MSTPRLKNNCGRCLESARHTRKGSSRADPIVARMKSSARQASRKRLTTRSKTGSSPAKSSADGGMLAALRAAVWRIPRGRVATYGEVARGAGYEGSARQVAWALSNSTGGIPWHRVVGAGGVIKLGGEPAFEQRMRL